MGHMGDPSNADKLDHQFSDLFHPKSWEEQDVTPIWHGTLGGIQELLPRLAVQQSKNQLQALDLSYGALCASKLEEIKQERPSGNSWTLWRKFLSTICTNDNENTIYNTKEMKGERIKRSIGNKITKYWSGVPYIGTIISNISRYYKVQYEDGDEEELNHGEVTKYGKKNRGEGRTTSEVGRRMRLRIKLGDWNKTANESDWLWPFYFSRTKDTLYRSYREEWHQQGKFFYDCHSRNRNNKYNYTKTENIDYLPADAVPTDVMDTEEGWRVSGHLPMMTWEKKTVQNGTFMEYLLSQEEHISQ
ncbi:MAG: hypothetical protein ACI90V_014093, partial [Bacillariaceae sp.]